MGPLLSPKCVLKNFICFLNEDSFPKAYFIKSLKYLLYANGFPEAENSAKD